MSFCWPRLKGCCYCFNLRVGSFIAILLTLILWTDYMIAFFFVSKDEVIFKIMTTLFLVVSGAIPAVLGMYAIYKNKVEYLLPFMIVSYIFKLYLFINAVVFTVMWIIDPKSLYDIVRKNSDSFRDKSKENLRREAAPYVCIFDLIHVVAVFVIWYFLNVVRSLDLQLRSTDPQVRYISDSSGLTSVIDAQIEDL